MRCNIWHPDLIDISEPHLPPLKHWWSMGLLYWTQLCRTCRIDSYWRVRGQLCLLLRFRRLFCASLSRWLCPTSCQDQILQVWAYLPFQSAKFLVCEDTIVSLFYFAELCRERAQVQDREGVGARGSSEGGPVINHSGLIGTEYLTQQSDSWQVKVLADISHENRYSLGFSLNKCLKSA